MSLSYTLNTTASGKAAYIGAIIPTHKSLRLYNDVVTVSPFGTYSLHAHLSPSMN